MGKFWGAHFGQLCGTLGFFWGEMSSSFFLGTTGFILFGTLAEGIKNHVDPHHQNQLSNLQKPLCHVFILVGFSYWHILIPI